MKSLLLLLTIFISLAGASQAPVFNLPFNNPTPTTDFGTGSPATFISATDVQFDGSRANFTTEDALITYSNANKTHIAGDKSVALIITISASTPEGYVGLFNNGGMRMYIQNEFGQCTLFMRFGQITSNTSYDIGVSIIPGQSTNLVFTYHNIPNTSNANYVGYVNGTVVDNQTYAAASQYPWIDNLYVGNAPTPSDT